LNKEFSTDVIQYYSYHPHPKTYKPQYFAKTDTKLSTLLMFYYFKSMYKGTGLDVKFKGPRDFSSLSEEEKKEVWKEVKTELKDHLNKLNSSS
jgi:hypothetical protein